VPEPELIVWQWRFGAGAWGDQDITSGSDPSTVIDTTGHTGENLQARAATLNGTTQTDWVYSAVEVI
jgi:hypothetical protein